MTQHYIAGEFSSLLAELRSAPTDALADALDALRQEVEAVPVASLPRLARQAVTLTDAICWAALTQGDSNGFCRYAGTAARLHEFSDNAHLLDG